MKKKRTLNQTSFLLLITILLFFVMYAVGCVVFKDQGFAKIQNFLNLFISNAGLIVISIGMTVVMITGGIDISVGSFVAMGCMMLAWMMEKGGVRGSCRPDRTRDRSRIRTGAGIPGGLYGYPALYRYPGGHVFRKGDDSDHLQGHDQHQQ